MGMPKHPLKFHLIPFLIPLLNFFDSLHDILKKYKHIDSLNKIIVDEFIDKVYIGNYNKENKTRDIEIEWNFEF